MKGFETPWIHSPCLCLILADIFLGLFPSLHFMLSCHNIYLRVWIENASLSLPCFFPPKLIPVCLLYPSPAIASVYFPAERFQLQSKCRNVNAPSHPCLLSPPSALLPLSFLTIKCSCHQLVAATFNGSLVCVAVCTTGLKGKRKPKNGRRQERKHWKVTSIDSIFFLNFYSFQSNFFLCVYICCGLVYVFSVKWSVI